ncbi:MAG: hypothetical protein ACRDRA_03870 [Pseudonocardiaceae bacterium]
MELEHLPAARWAYVEARTEERESAAAGLHRGAPTRRALPDSA